MIDIQLPAQIECTVAETSPNPKTSASQGSLKPAILDSGLEVMVPMFIEVGQKVMVSSEDAKYVGKSN